MPTIENMLGHVWDVSDNISSIFVENKAFKKYIDWIWQDFPGG